MVTIYKNLNTELRIHGATVLRGAGIQEKL